MVYDYLFICLFTALLVKALTLQKRKQKKRYEHKICPSAKALSLLSTCLLPRNRATGQGKVHFQSS